MSRTGGSDFEGTRAEMDRAIRSLGVLEQLFLLVAAVAALIAGALIAWILGQAADLPFRPTWAITSIALFVIPGGISMWRTRSAERADTARGPESNSEPES